jgi:hypothetical protein
MHPPNPQEQIVQCSPTDGRPSHQAETLGPSDLTSTTTLPAVDSPPATPPAIIIPLRLAPAPFVTPRISPASVVASNPLIAASLPALRKHFAVRTHDELALRCSELGGTSYVIEDLFPARSIGIVVGDSGFGKSPLLYQAGICVAAGVPFLGQAVSQGKVLYLDYENGLQDSLEMTRRLSSHLGLEAVPAEFTMWHYNDCSSDYSKEDHTIFDMIKALRPRLTIIDSLSAYCPEAEDKNSAVTPVFQGFRRAIRDFETTIVVVHHIKKPSNKPSEQPTPLDECDPKEWLFQTRGARALINSSDVRLAVGMPGVSGGLRNTQHAPGDRLALVLRGFGRIRGEIGPLFIARVHDEEHEPLGYRHLRGVDLLFNDDQEAAFERLPPSFTTGEAERIYERGSQATSDFLNKCIRSKLLRKVGRGRFEKCEGTE